MGRTTKKEYEKFKSVIFCTTLVKGTENKNALLTIPNLIYSVYKILYLFGILLLR